MENDLVVANTFDSVFLKLAGTAGNMSLPFRKYSD